MRRVRREVTRKVILAALVWRAECRCERNRLRYASQPFAWCCNSRLRWRGQRDWDARTRWRLQRTV